MRVAFRWPWKGHPGGSGPFHPFMSCPGGVALAGVNNGFRQVIAKAAAWPPLRPTACSVTAGFVRRRCRAVKRGQLVGTIEGIAVGRAVKLDGLVDNAGARSLLVSTSRYPSDSVPPAAVRPSRPASCASGRMAIRLPPAFTQSVNSVTWFADSDP